MSFDYNSLLREELYSLKNTVGLDEYDFIVDSEQSFIKYKDLKPNTIYVLTKTLQNNYSVGVEVQPVQIMILSEQNSLEVAKAFFSQFAKNYNFHAGTYDTVWVKEQYTDPVVLSNFNTVNYGYRSVLYMSTTLYIMYDVVDVSDLKIDDENLTPLSFNISYTASMNTQAYFQETIARSVKSVSSLSIAISLPVVKSELMTKIVSIMASEEGYTGNEVFSVSFALNEIEFELNMRLMSAQFGTAPNQIPTINIGLML